MFHIQIIPEDKDDKHNYFLNAYCFYFKTGPWRDCLQALEDGHDTSSIYLVKPENTNRLMQVWCDQRHDPGGWTVIQRRLDGSVNFFRNWDTYKVRTNETCFLFPVLMEDLELRA